MDADPPSRIEPPVPRTVLGASIQDSASRETIVAAEDAAPQIEGYRIIGKLGEGGMGIVWQAVQLSTNRTVAIKVLRKASLRSEWIRSRFQRELDVMARLEHPHIARVYHGGVTADGIWHYVMEHVSGRHLDLYVKEKNLPHQEILRLTQTVCEAVQHAHQSGVIHRDLKPSNILVDQEGKPRVLDFGLAKVVSASNEGPAITMEGHVAGTPSYMSPEQAAGLNSLVDTRSDVYSLGVILFQLLTGKFPHDPSGSNFEVLRRIVEHEPQRLSSLLPKPNRDLEAIVGKALSKSADQRYAIAGGLAADLRRHLANEPIEARRPRLRDLLVRRIIRHKALVATTAAVGMVMVATVVWSYWRVTRERNLALASQHDEVNAKRYAVEMRKQAEAAREAAVRERDDARTAKASAKILEKKAEEDRAAAVAAKEEAEAARRQAEKGELEVSQQLARSLTDEGIERLEDGKFSLALLRLVEALRIVVELKDPAAEKAARTRIGTTYRGLQRADGAPMRLWRAAVNPGRSGKPGMTLTTTVSAINNLGPVFSHYPLVQSSDLSSERDYVVTGGTDNAVKIWDVAEREPGKPRAQLSVGSRVQKVVFSSDDQFVLICHGNVARIWDWQREKTIDLRHDGELTWAEFDPTGQRVVTAGKDKTARVWEAQTGKLIHTIMHGSALRFACFSADSKRVLTADERTTALWDSVTHRQVGDWIQHDFELGPPVLSKAGKKVLTLKENAVSVWDLTTGQQLGGPLKHPHRVFSAAFSPDASHVVTGGEGRSASLWEVSSGKTLPLTIQHGSDIRVVAFSPNGARILTGSSDFTARVWDARTGKPISRPLQHDSGVRLASFSPDGELVAVADDRQTRVWDVESGQVVSPPLKHDGRISEIQFSPTGLGVLSTGIERSARWIDLSPENRSVDDMIEIFSYLADKKMDQTRGAISLTVEERIALYKQLSVKYPEEFPPDKAPTTQPNRPIGK